MTGTLLSTERVATAVAALVGPGARNAFRRIGGQRPGMFLLACPKLPRLMSGRPGVQSLDTCSVAGGVNVTLHEFGLTAQSSCDTIFRSSSVNHCSAAQVGGARPCCTGMAVQKLNTCSRLPPLALRCRAPFDRRLVRLRPQRHAIARQPIGLRRLGRCGLQRPAADRSLRLIERAVLGRGRQGAGFAGDKPRRHELRHVAVSLADVRPGSADSAQIA